MAVFNANLWSVAARTGAVVLDQWGAPWIYDVRLWDADRIHLTAEGHRRTALAAAAELGVPVPDDGWRTPLLPPQPPRPLRVAVTEEVAWLRGFVAPWVARRLRWCSRAPGASGSRRQCRRRRPIRSGRRPRPSAGARPRRRTPRR